MQRDIAPVTKARPGALLGGLLAGILAIGSLASPAVAGPPDQEVYRSSARVSLDELRGMRGGFSFQGVDFDFGAIVTVRSDGTRLAETTFTLNDAGGLQRDLRIFDGSRVSAFGGGAVSLEGFDARFPEGIEGVIVAGADGGATLALNDLRPGLLSNIVLNNAAGQNIQQDFRASITINNFSELRAGILNAQTLNGLKTFLNDRSLSGF